MVVLSKRSPRPNRFTDQARKAARIRTVRAATPAARSRVFVQRDSAQVQPRATRGRARLRDRRENHFPERLCPTTEAWPTRTGTPVCVFWNSFTRKWCNVSRRREGDTWRSVVCLFVCLFVPGSVCVRAAHRPLKAALPKLFLGRPKSWFREHLATQDANIVLKNYWLCVWLLAVSC